MDKLLDRMALAQFWPSGEKLHTLGAEAALLLAIRRTQELADLLSEISIELQRNKLDATS